MSAPIQCEQRCESLATVYAGGNFNNDWAGYYCDTCCEALGFTVFDQLRPTTEDTE
jgi:hypothetical protein